MQRTKKKILRKQVEILHELRNGKATRLMICVCSYWIEANRNTPSQKLWMLIKADHKNPQLSFTAFSGSETHFKLVTLCCFEGSRSKSPEDSMEVEGIDDWKKEENCSEISMTSLFLRGWKSNVNSILSVHLLPWGPEVTQCDTSITQLVQWRPKSKPKCCQFSPKTLCLSMRRKVFEPKCQFQSLNPTHHGNAAATDEGPWVQGDGRGQRGV